MGCDADQLACTNDGRYDHSTWLTEWVMDQYESAKGVRKGWIQKWTTQIEVGTHRTASINIK